MKFIDFLFIFQVANRAGLIIRDVMKTGDLGIVDKVRCYYELPVFVFVLLTL